ncbi:ssDNA-binding protein, mitochondrial [Xylographa bjoerkii]|nr:ssDNA-binding protein, mitochondrial [Xylographa bjoerkii]
MPPLLRPALLPRSLTSRLFSTSRALPIARITIVGRLAADPELTVTSTGQEMVKYAVGTSYGPRENRQTSWWRVASFAKEGEGRERVLGLGKGTLVYLEGDASMRKYEKDGKVESALSIVQQKLEVLKRPDSSLDSLE